MPTIQNYEEAVDYIYGGQAGSTTYWTIEPRENGGPRWMFTYCDVYGNPVTLHGMTSDVWYANLDDLNISVSHLKPGITVVQDQLTPVIRKIRKLEARFKERVNA